MFVMLSLSLYVYFTIFFIFFLMLLCLVPLEIGEDQFVMDDEYWIVRLETVLWC